MTIDDDWSLIMQACEACSSFEEGYPAAAQRAAAERKYMLDNLTATQTRCTELINRAREQTPPEIAQVASEVLAGRSRSYVQAAQLLARWVLKHEDAR